MVNKKQKKVGIKFQKGRSQESLYIDSYIRVTYDRKSTNFPLHKSPLLNKLDEEIEKERIEKAVRYFESIQPSFTMVGFGHHYRNLRIHIIKYYDEVLFQFIESELGDILTYNQYNKIDQGAITGDRGGFASHSIEFIVAANHILGSSLLRKLSKPSQAHFITALCLLDFIEKSKHFILLDWILNKSIIREFDEFLLKNSTDYATSYFLSGSHLASKKLSDLASETIIIRSVRKLTGLFDRG